MIENLAYYIALFAMGGFLIRVAELDTWFCAAMRCCGTGLMTVGVVLTLKGII